MVETSTHRLSPGGMRSSRPSAPDHGIVIVSVALYGRADQKEVIPCSRE